MADEIRLTDRGDGVFELAEKDDSPRIMGMRKELIKWGAYLMQLHMEHADGDDYLVVCVRGKGEIEDVRAAIAAVEARWEEE